jgi:hypothetical protein
MENIGKILYGYCNGYFGRDDYADKIIVFETTYSICCRYVGDDGLYKCGEDWKDVPQVEMLTVANFRTRDEKQKLIDECSNKLKDNK